MRALVVYAHPVEGSFCSLLRDTVVESLERTGHEVDLLDLWADNFDPVLTPFEHTMHRAHPETKPALGDQIERLRNAQGLVLVYPTWWGGQPAILKGWFDRVWIRGVAYDLPDGARRVRPLLHNVRWVLVVTSHGSSKWINMVQGEPGKRVVLRGLRSMCGVRTRTKWIACYRMDTIDDESRMRFLQRVRKAMSRL
ncbi:MAG: NAD(P)H-dependent oxidoreductase [Actinomycetota bacterium]